MAAAGVAGLCMVGGCDIVVENFQSAADRRPTAVALEDADCGDFGCRRPVVDCSHVDVAGRLVHFVRDSVLDHIAAGMVVALDAVDLGEVHAVVDSAAAMEGTQDVAPEVEADG